VRASFSRGSNAVKNVLFRSFSTPMYASQLWWNIRKSCMQRLRVPYNFGCRALYNLYPGERVLVVMTHQVRCNIITFESLLRKNMHLFLKRCRRSNNVMVACFNAARLFILRCGWVLGQGSVCSFEGVHVTMHSYFIWVWPVQGLASHSAVVLYQANK